MHLNSIIIHYDIKFDNPIQTQVYFTNLRTVVKIPDCDIHTYIYIYIYGWILCTILVRLIYYVRTWVEDIKID